MLELLPRDSSESAKLPGWSSQSRLYFEVPMKPVIDEYVLPKHPDSMFRDFPLKRKPELLLGVNKNEGMYFLVYYLSIQNAQFLKVDGTVTLPEEIRLAGQRKPLKGEVADFRWITASQILDEILIHPVTHHLASLYYGLPTDTNSPQMSYADPFHSRITGEEVMEKLDALTGDIDFICPTLNFAERVAEIPDSKVFLYSFEHRTSALDWPMWTGVMHGQEVEYVFGMPRSKAFVNKFYNFTSAERSVSDTVMKYWGNFAKYG